MSWSDEAHRLSLLELVQRGALSRRRSREALIEQLLDCGWVRQGPRADEVLLSERRRGDVCALLDRIFPGWQATAEALSAADLPPTAAGLKALHRSRRAAAVLPERLNRRVAMSLLAEHSKVDPAGLAGSQQLTLTRDSAVRLRPNDGLLITRAGRSLDARALAQVQGELLLTERALSSGTALSGRLPRGILSVENLGAYIELPAPDWLLVLYVPGWDTPAARLLLSQLPDVPAAHFGDLDPQGLAIVEHLRRERPTLRWFIPSFWADELGDAAPLTADWTGVSDRRELPALVRTLAERGLWLEQERIVLHPELPAELEQLFQPSPAEQRP